MKIILTGSLGHISQPVAEQLISLGHQVTVISHNPDRAAAISALGATPAIGDIHDQAFLTATFTGADAVYLMITAASGDDDIFGAGRQQAEIYAQAVLAAGVSQVVNLSSVGANYGPEVGALHIYNVIEGVLSQALARLNVTFIRPTGMYYNLFGNLQSIKANHTIVTNADITKRNSWVAPEDIAPVVVQALTAPQPGITSQYVASDEKSYEEIATIFGQALNMPDLKAVQISDDQALQGILASGAPASFATELIKMYGFERDNDFYADYRAHQPILGPTKLTDFAKTFAKVYEQ